MNSGNQIKLQNNMVQVTSYTSPQGPNTQLPSLQIHHETNPITLVLGEILGTGRFAIVFKGSTQQDDGDVDPDNVKVHFTPQFKLSPNQFPCVIPRKMNQFAVKFIDKKIGSKKVSRSVQREIEVLSKSSHLRSVAQLYFAHETSTAYYLFLEYCPGNNLFTKRQSQTIARDEALNYLREIAITLCDLHHLGILYHDLKPENICFDKNGRTKLVDFGMACLLTDDDLHKTTNRREIVFNDTYSTKYTSPEILLRKSHAFEADWWSYGILMYELLFDCHPFAIEQPTVDWISYISSCTNDFVSNDKLNLGSDEEKLCKMFLAIDPVKRYGYHHSDKFFLENHITWQTNDMSQWLNQSQSRF